MPSASEYRATCRRKRTKPYWKMGEVYDVSGVISEMKGVRINLEGADILGRFLARPPAQKIYRRLPQLPANFAID
ncbi:hypothetical protein BSKO_05006 [Bryopsis sp. KO-2023]|nr:hypothetical protein BSKO_05006 [Bryopsis sp. KO-2023]